MATQPNPGQGNPSQGTEKTIRLVRPSIVVLCGPAACGKSTFAERHFRATQIISSDWARGRVCDDERDQRYQAQAFALVHFLIEQRLSLNRLCVVDSTALTTQARRELLELARRYQVPSIAFLFEISLEKCLERDQTRERTVGRAVIERQHQLFEQAKETIRQEGFEQVIELQDGDIDKARIEIVFRPVSRPAAAPARSGPGAWRRPPKQGGSVPTNFRTHAPAGGDRRPPAPGQGNLGTPTQRPSHEPQPLPSAPGSEGPPASPKSNTPVPNPRPASPGGTNEGTQGSQTNTGEGPEHEKSKENASD